jgi:hypothetical protein
MSEYTEQANKFMEDSGTIMTVTFLRHAPHFEDDKDSRDIYHIVLERKGKKMEFDFGQSIVNSVPPSAPNQPWGTKPKKRIAPDTYSVLACLTKYDVDGDVWEFAKEFGYEINSRESFNRIDKIHMAVIKEYRDVHRLFGDVMEQLCEIS